MLSKNPVTIKELRGQVRGFRAFAVLTVYLGLASGLMLVMYSLIGSPNMGGTTTGGTLGKTLFGAVFFAEMFLTCLIGPAFTSGAITGERERQTWDLLNVTLLHPRQIVMGKLWSSVAFLLLLLVASIPLQSLAFLMGGVTIAELLLASVLLTVSAVSFSALGMFFSATQRRTLGSTLLTYGVTLGIVLGLPVSGTFILSFLGVFSILFYGSYPVFEAVMLYGSGLLLCLNPFSTAIATEIMLLQEDSALGYMQYLSTGGAIPVPSPWLVFTIIYLTAAAILLALSVQAVGRPER